jgi:glycosyltransferase involved in cell wall biosynthesis
MEVLMDKLNIPRGHSSVVVLMLAFNSELYIKKALNSFLEQDLKNSRVLVFDDCSGDSTRRILHDYELSHPERVFVCRPKVNSLSAGNPDLPFRILEAVEADFIAILDADDYWNSPRKLSASVAALEDSGASLVGHSVTVVGKSRGNGGLELAYQWISKLYASQSRMAKLLATSILVLPTCTLVLRKEALPFTEMQWLAKLDTPDLFIKLWAHANGGIVRITPPMSNYRLSNGSIWSNKSNITLFASAIASSALAYKRFGFAAFLVVIRHTFLWTTIRLLSEAATFLARHRFNR